MVRASVSHTENPGSIPGSTTFYDEVVWILPLIQGGIPFCIFSVDQELC